MAPDALSVTVSAPSCRPLSRLSSRAPCPWGEVRTSLWRIRGGLGAGSATGGGGGVGTAQPDRSEEHTSELQSHSDLVCRLLLEKKKICIAEAVNYRRVNFNRPIVRPEGDRIVVHIDMDGDGKADDAVTFYQRNGNIAPIGAC